MSEIMDKIEFLFEKYSTERRASTQPYLWQKINELFPEHTYEPEDNLVRETLMEHVGSLPVIATALYPYIDDSEVDLGEALVMLAVHDIGELIVHDEITFTKQADGKAEEHKAALQLLDPRYHALYMNLETLGSKSARFAKAIDKITPDIVDYLTPVDITVCRFKHFVGVERDQIVDLIVQHKRPYMLWNPFLTEFHTYLMRRLEEKLAR